MSQRLTRRWYSLLLALSTILPTGVPGQAQVEDNPYKVYVILGFHASFYHSWRGDTPDEAGFGTDIRLGREIIRMRDQANAEGLPARGYWDFDVYWTLEQIIPASRWHIPNLENGQSYVFQLRALAQGRESAWTPEARCVPGPVKAVSLVAAASGVSPWTMLKMICHSLRHALTTR